MTWTGYYRAFLRALRTGLGVYAASVLIVLIGNFPKLDYWYIATLAAVISGFFKIMREKYPDSKLWKYLPL